MLTHFVCHHTLTYQSQHALGLLLKAGVGVVLRLKGSTMARIARHTGAPMLDSVDMLAHGTDNFFGRCGRFYLRTYSIAVAEHSPERAGDIVYMFVEGCPPERGVTLLLRGAAKSTLRAVKSIATRAIVRARHLRFETSLLRDVGISVPHPVFAAAKLDMLDARRAARGAAPVDAAYRARVAADLAALRREMEEAPPALGSGSQYLGVLRTHADAGMAGGTPYANAQVKPTQWRKVNFYSERASARANGTQEEADLTLLKYLRQSGRSSRDFKQRMSYTAESGKARLHATLELVAPPEPELTRAAQESNPLRDERLNFSISRDSTPLVWVWCCKCGCVLREPAALSADTLAISFHRFVAMMLGADGVPETQRHVLPCCGSKVSTHAMWFICRSPLQAARGADGVSSGVGLLDGNHHHIGNGHGSIFGGGGAGDHPRWLLTRFEHEVTQPFAVRR